MSGGKKLSQADRAASSIAGPQFLELPSGEWVCVDWPLRGYGSTKHYAWVDLELRKLLTPSK